MTGRFGVKFCALRNLENITTFLFVIAEMGGLDSLHLKVLFNGKTVTKEQDPIVIATTLDRRNVASDFETNKIYPRNVTIPVTI